MFALNNLYLIVGQSGSGKSTIADKLEKKYGLKQVLSYTTREPRYEGEDTHEFISEEEFDELTDIVAFTEFNGHRYCATSEKLDGCDTYIIDPAGVDTLRCYYHTKPLKIIYIKVTAPLRYERMKERASGELMERVESALERIGYDAHEFYNYEHGLVNIDFTVKNEGDVDEAVEKVYEYIQTAEVSEEGETDDSIPE